MSNEYTSAMQESDWQGGRYIIHSDECKNYILTVFSVLMCLCPLINTAPVMWNDQRMSSLYCFHLQTPQLFIHIKNISSVLVYMQQQEVVEPFLRRCCPEVVFEPPEDR